MSMTTNEQTLLQRIEKALKDFTNGRASMHVPPLDTDVDMVLADCATALEAAERRNAELEARTVKLPEPISVLHRRDFNDAHCSIYAYPEAEVNAALAAAGISIAAATDKGE